MLSRCQRFDLRRIKSAELVDHLSRICGSEKVEAEHEALQMIARASEGSVRDALSILDQAIAHSAGEENSAITATAVRSMLGLSDAARVIELFHSVMKGDVAAALNEIRSQYEIGAEPAVVLGDLANFIHLVTRMKFVANEVEDNALPEMERNRAREYSQTISVMELSRAWQILLKGLGEVGQSEHALAVAEMVLVRLAHASTLPLPEQLLAEHDQSSAGQRPATSEDDLGRNKNGGPQAQSRPVATPDFKVSAQDPGATSMSGSDSAVALGNVEPAPITEHEHQEQNTFRTLNNFEDLIFLVEDQRDLKLKLAIKRHIRLVSFADGRMDMNLVENPPRDFMAQLSRRLEEWTGKRWMLSVSKQPGQPTLQEQEEAENTAKTREAMNDPAVEEVLTSFPGSKVVDIRIREGEVASVPVDPDDDLIQ